MIDRFEKKSLFWPTMVGLFAPIVGIFMYFSWHVNQPREAKAALTGAILSIIVIGILIALLVVLKLILFFNLI
jgi:hypothetical protein